jgi:hypothetical protein
MTVGLLEGFGIRPTPELLEACDRVKLPELLNVAPRTHYALPAPALAAFKSRYAVQGKGTAQKQLKDTAKRLDAIAAPGIAFTKAFLNQPGLKDAVDRIATAADAHAKLTRPTKFDLMRKQVREKFKKMNNASSVTTAATPPMSLTCQVDFDEKTQKFFAVVGDKKYTGARRRDLARLLKKKGLTAIYGDKPKD